MGPGTTQIKTDGTGMNSNKDRWGRSKLMERQSGPGPFQEGQIGPVHVIPQKGQNITITVPVVGVGWCGSDSRCVNVHTHDMSLDISLYSK